ncbi:sensor domain-containing protein [Streptomyces mirabilis]|uniref:sensor histidine kinase n=1 Tax=Streptomyces mirabilis TaxID=68239 RepID=UPI0036902DF1
MARPYLPTPDGDWPMRLWAILRDPATWRDWAWLVANSITGWFTYGLSFLFFLCGVFYLSYPLLYALTPPQVFRTPLGNGFRLHSVQESFAMVPLGPVFLLLWYTTAERLAHLNALVIRSLLAPTAQAQLRARVAQLAASRAETVDTQAGELRRIERDLHDGAQARLVSLVMSLGLAEQLLPDDPPGCPAAAGRGPRIDRRRPGRTPGPGTRHPSAGARGPRPGRRPAGPGPGQTDTDDGGHPPARTVARAGRVRGLLRRRRGPGERDQARPRPGTSRSPWSSRPTRARRRGC